MQAANVHSAAPALAAVAHHQLVLSHGNGPQVGLLALQGAAYEEVEAYPLDVLGAQTERHDRLRPGAGLGNLLPFEVPFATVLTMIEVDQPIRQFGDPTKFVGPVYDKAEADGLAAEKGWAFKQDGDRWRRVVPSPEASASSRSASLVAPGQGRRRDLRGVAGSRCTSRTASGPSSASRP